MRKILLTLAAMAIIAASCQKENEQSDWYTEASIELENVLGKVKQSTEIDDALLIETLLNYTVVPTFCATKEDGTWEPYRKAPGEIGSCGVLFYEAEVYQYYFKMMEGTLTKSIAYTYNYDTETNTLNTDSAIHDYTFSCEVKYFDGSYLILEGLFAPLDDLYNDNYADYYYLREFKVDKEIRKSLEDGTYTR